MIQPDTDRRRRRRSENSRLYFGKSKDSGKAGLEFTFTGTRLLTRRLGGDTRHTVLEVFYNQAKKALEKSDTTLDSYGRFVFEKVKI